MLTLVRSEEQRILGQFSPEFLERLGNRLMIERFQAEVAAGRLPSIGGGAKAYYLTNAEAISMLTDYGAGLDAGTAAVINIYSGSVPADGDASLGGATLLAQLTCSATAFASVTDANPGAVATFDDIAPDSSADNDGTASFFRILTQSGGTVVGQGTVGTSDADLVLNTTSITTGSEVSISSATITLPEGPTP